MNTIEAPIQSARYKTYNESHPFTRRIPSFLTEKQKQRDAKIVKKIIVAFDMEGDKEKVRDIFFSKCTLLSDPVYWEVLRSVWVVSGTTENAPSFIPYFKSNRRARSYFMTPEDAEYLESLTFPITLWRAYKDENKDEDENENNKEEDTGISWTNDYEWCKTYAKDRQRKIKEAQFSREQIFAYISRRGESEFIVLPE